MEEADETEAVWEAATPEFAELERFLRDEHDAQTASHEAVYDLPIEERAAAGRAIAGVRYERTEGEKSRAVHVFSCEKNSSRFRPGTRLRLSRRDPRHPAAALELVEDRFDGKRYQLKLSGTVEDPEELAGEQTWVLDEDVFDLLGTQLSILEAAQESSLGDWLAGKEELGTPASAGFDAAFAEGLQGNMLTAFHSAVSARGYFAVQGPPGSGKTHLLARLALYYALEENKRVLITAVSHQAIHHALGETYFVGKRMSAAHPGTKALLQEGFYKLGASRGNNEGLPDGVRAAVRLSAHRRPMIAGATLYAALHPAWGFSKHPFDVILFDEAGQAPLILALAARLLSRKTVFIGDDAQLPPVVNLPPGEDGGSLGSLSALEFIRKEYEDPFLLTETRRLNARLCSLVSDCFYDGALEPTPEAASRKLELSGSPAQAFSEILSPEESLVFVDVPHEDSKSICEGEALWAAAIAAEAVRCGVAPEDVGIIAPYRAQGNRIRFLLGKRSRVVCSTVERFQGQEREIVILSLTSSHMRYLSRLAGFLFDPHRLNVAVSRARTKVVILGAKRALSGAVEAGETSDPDASFSRGFEIFRRLLGEALVVDGSRIPRPRAEEDDGEEALLPGVAKARPEGTAFEPGETVDHPVYGIGQVLSKGAERIDNRLQWVNRMRFSDGKVRLIVPGLSNPPIKRTA